MTPLDSGKWGHAAEPVREHIAIPVTTLWMDEVLEFALYLPGANGGAPVLYRAKDTPFSDDARMRLREAGQDSLLILSSDRSSYSRYLERNLGQIVLDASLPLEERSATLYYTSKELMFDLMTDPRSGDIMNRSANVVDHTVSLLFNESQSFRHLISITSSDYYTYTHSVNVFVFSTALAQRLGHDASELREFGQGALLHDIGKSLVPNDVLNAKGKLTEAQWAEMRLHPVHGWNILREQGVESEMVLDVTRHHHEKLNGKGYPDGLAGDEISHWARITTIADIFDALTTRRSYKEALNSFPSLQLMREHMADELDPDCFRCFVELMARP